MGLPYLYPTNLVFCKFRPRICIMATRRVELGPTGQTVRANVAAIRKRRGLTLRDLSEKMPSDHPLSHTTISEIERGARRVDVDDLWTLAVALQTTPYDLMGVESAAKPLSPAAQQIIDLVTLLDFKGDLGGKNWDSKESYLDGNRRS
jgi:transcriptional regulator with XRE-family HTH domain